MAIPGVFAPVERDGHVLADGGLVDNLPAGVVRQMGVEKVIAIDLRTPLGGPEQLQTIGGVLARAVDVMIVQNERHSMALADVVITLEPGKYSISDYSAAEQIIRIGYEGAAKQAGQLLPYAVTEAEGQQYLAERAARKRTSPQSVDALEGTGGSGGEQQRLAPPPPKAIPRPPLLKALLLPLVPL